MAALDSVRIRDRNNVFYSILVKEETFLKNLKYFIDNVINPLNLKDNTFKRSFLAQPAVTVSFNIIIDIYKNCLNFTEVLKKINCENDKSIIEVCEAFKQFAPSLVLFAQYASKNLTMLNAINSSEKSVNENITDRNLNIANAVVSPLLHYLDYSTGLKNLLSFTPEDSNDYKALEKALDDVEVQTDHVNETLKGESDSIQLLQTYPGREGGGKISRK